MKVIESIGLWISIGFVVSIAFILILITLKAIGQWVSENIKKIDKAIDISVNIGTIVFAAAIVTVIIGSIILVFNRIF